MAGLGRGRRPSLRVACAGVEVVRHNAHQLRVRMDSLLQELPPAAAGDAHVRGTLCHPPAFTSNFSPLKPFWTHCLPQCSKMDSRLLQ